ncbi:MAG: glycosyltransferase family 4 protein [Polyangiaceae bacterium]|nr:glycosyltransferase family 4 protein [Polyangiaceae bacterium]
MTEILARLDGPRVVFTQREGRFTDAWRAAGCDVRMLDVSEPRALSGAELAAYRVRRMPEIVRANVAVLRAIRELRSAVVHCNDPGALWYAAPGALAAGAQVVLNVRDTRPDRQYGPRWRVMRHIARTIVVLSEEMRAEIDSQLKPLAPFVPHADIRAIYSAVDLRRMTPVAQAIRADTRRRLGIGEREYAVAYVGTFNDKKNQLEFIERAAGPLLSSPERRLYFIGDFRPDADPYASKCRAAIERQGLSSQTSFVGFSETPHDWYRAVDAVCLASRNEGLARAMIESLACGTPVVSFDVSSAREILEHYDAGVVVPQGDYATLVRELAQLEASPAERCAKGERGARAAHELFEPERSVARYAELYGSLSGGV